MRLKILKIHLYFMKVGYKYKFLKFISFLDNFSYKLKITGN